MTVAGEPESREITLKSGEVATVQVKVRLSSSGSIIETSIYKSSGYQLLDEAALNAARASTYSPEIEDCQPISGTYLYRADFKQASKQ